MNDKDVYLNGFCNYAFAFAFALSGLSDQPINHQDKIILILD